MAPSDKRCNAVRACVWGPVLVQGQAYLQHKQVNSNDLPACLLVHEIMARRVARDRFCVQCVALGRLGLASMDLVQNWP